MDSLYFPPLPVPIIKSECEEIIIDAECSDDCDGKSKTDLWDEEIRKKIAKLVVYQNEKLFIAVIEEYLKLLKRHSLFIENKHNLIDKIANHIQMFATFYEEAHETSFQQKYLDVMEEVLTVFSNAQMDIARKIKKRGCNKSEYVVVVRTISQKMCRLLSSSLLHNLKHILHVLLKATKHDVEPPSWKDIMNTVYSHFLIQYPMHDYSSESFCRNFLLFERWKEITKVENHKDMEETLYYRCRQTPKTIKSDKLISSILMPSSIDSVSDIVTHLIKGKSDAIKSYFDYIEKQKKKSAADESICLNDLSFGDLEDDFDYMDRGSDECSKVFSDIVRTYENAKTGDVPSVNKNNRENNEDLGEEVDCIVIDDDDVSEYEQKESNMVCVISDSDSDCEMVYLLDPTKKKKHTKVESTKNTPSIPQLWSKTFPESTRNTNSVSKTNSSSAQSDGHDDDIEILDSECVSSVELSGQKSGSDHNSISFDVSTQIQKLGSDDIREVLRNLVVAPDPPLTEADHEVETVDSSNSFKDIRVSTTPDKSIQIDSNDLSSNVTDSNTDHSRENNVQNNSCHHCSCCSKNKQLASSSSLLMSSNKDSGDNREIERSKNSEILTEIQIEELGLMPSGHTYSYGLITPPSDQPAEGSSSPTRDNVYVEIPVTDSPRSVINSESEEVAPEYDVSSNDNFTEDAAEDSLAKDDSSNSIAKKGDDIDKENPTENDKETLELVNESVGQKAKEVVETITNGVEENNSVRGNGAIEKNDVNATNDEVESTISAVSEEIITFRDRSLPNEELSVVDNVKQPIDPALNIAEATNGSTEISFSTISSADAELTNYPQYVIIDGQPYVVSNEIQSDENLDTNSEVVTTKNFSNFVTNCVYLDENGKECIVENDNDQHVIVDDVYYSCENGLLTIEEVNQSNSLENVTENVNHLDLPNNSSVASNINSEDTLKCHNTEFSDVTSTTPTETISERVEENVKKSEPKKSESDGKIVFTSTESIKLTDFDKFEKSINGKLVDLDEHNDLWESAFVGPVTKLNSNLSANFSEEIDEMCSFQDTEENKQSSKKNTSETICRSHSVSPIVNSPEYDLIETSDFKKYIQEKDNTEKKTTKEQKQNSLLIHLDKSKIPESLFQKAKEQKMNQRASEEVQIVTKSILKRKSVVSESSNPNKKRAGSISPTTTKSSLHDPYKFEPNNGLKKKEKVKENSVIKSHKTSRRSSESEKQKAIEVVFGKSKYMKHNNDHLAEESKRKPKEELEEHKNGTSFIELKNLSSFRKQQLAYSCVIKYYSKRRKVYDPRLFQMLPEVSLPYFGEEELLKKWDSQRLEKINNDRWKTLEKYLKVNHKDRGMKRSCIQERVFYDRSMNSSKVIVYNGGSTHESTSLTTSGAKNYNSGKHQQRAHLLDKTRGNGVVLEKSIPPRKRGNTRNSVSNKKVESIATSYQRRNTYSNDVSSNAAGRMTSEEKNKNQTFRSVGPNLNHLELNSTLQPRDITSNKLQNEAFNTHKRKQSRNTSIVDPFPTKNNGIKEYEYSKKAKLSYSEPVKSVDVFDLNHRLGEDKKSLNYVFDKISNDRNDEIQMVNCDEPGKNYNKQAQHSTVSNSKTLRGIRSQENNVKKKGRVSFDRVIVNYYDVESTESDDNSVGEQKMKLNCGSLRTNGTSKDRNGQQITTSNAIKKVFENKIKNKLTNIRTRNSDKDQCKVNLTSELQNEVPLKKCSENLEHELSDLTTVGLEPLTDGSLNDGQAHKLFKTPAEKKELPPLPVKNGRKLREKPPITLTNINGNACSKNNTSSKPFRLDLSFLKQS